VYPHFPEAHVAAAFAGGLQTVPHAPQFFTSASVGMQAPLHLLKPGAHSMSHLLAMHTAAPFAGTGQAFPHPPQLAALIVVSTHAPPQATVPAPHEPLQTLDEHTSPGPHAPSHPPQ
jgi:hypothetical protein